MSENLNEDRQINARQNAVAGYRTYGVGVSILSNPDETSRIHGGDIETEPGEIISIAKDLMILGLGDVIRYSNPEVSTDARKGSLENLENKFSNLVPNMRTVVDLAFEDQRFTSKIEQLSPAFVIIRPAPMCVEGIYKNICRSRKNQVTIAALMMGTPIDKRFDETVLDSSVDPLPQHEAAYDLSQLAAEHVEEVEKAIGQTSFPYNN